MTQCEPPCPTHICAEMTKAGMCAMPRYGIGQDAENDEYLVEDHAKHRLIARSSMLGLEDLQALVGLANQGARTETTIAAADTLLAAAANLIAGQALTEKYKPLLMAMDAYKALRK